MRVRNHDMTQLTTLVSFNGTNGADPAAVLTADATGNLYGTTFIGGANNHGTIFEVAAGTGALTTLVSFNGTNGDGPHGTLTADSMGNLYGMTGYGGANNKGTVFELAAGNRALTTLVSFDGTNGVGPTGDLTADAAGNLYGTTSHGGVTGSGTVFELAAGTRALTTLVTFDGPNGVGPTGDLTADAAGNLYGTTAGGGTGGFGTVFEIAAGTRALTTLVRFSATNGANPWAEGIASVVR